MADRLTPARRSENMRRIKNKDMKPELEVRRLIFSLGFRYRIHKKDLPGRPDIVLPKHKAIIFVHGCFWHQHSKQGCSDAKVPETNIEYWMAKLERNRERDKKNRADLIKMGWRVLILWECEIKDKAKLLKKVSAFLSK